MCPGLLFVTKCQRTQLKLPIGFELRVPNARILPPPPPNATSVPNVRVKSSVFLHWPQPQQNSTMQGRRHSSRYTARTALQLATHCKDGATASDILQGRRCRWRYTVGTALLPSLREKRSRTAPRSVEPEESEARSVRVETPQPRSRRIRHVRSTLRRLRHSTTTSFNDHVIQRPLATFSRGKTQTRTISGITPVPRVTSFPTFPPEVALRLR